ncbi:MAG: metallophosphoesterase [Planctomycetes bacterium]|jgi:hypothetical protein|nr:metallophosphoesterase [Planctomycetota bacterium]HPY74708.1 metallophosphoesterase [Planctomycetota bacterium]HQB00259.1 metallophosphoesterase [Planctomycetota bacterium]
MNRREFLKCAVAGTVLGPSLLASSIDIAEQDYYYAEGLQNTWHHTTLHHRVVPTSHFIQEVLGIDMHRAVGETMTVRNDLLENNSLPSRNPKSLLFFHHITDAHVLDEESPARFVAAAPYLETIGVHNAFRKQEDLTTQVLNSMVQTMNGICSDKKLDFVLNTGDSVDNAQENELSWFLSTMRGGEVDPDSGTDQDPLFGPNNDGNDAFLAHGLLATIPWYSAIGNHDVLIQGNVPPKVRTIFNSIIGKVSKLLVLQDPVGDYSNAVITPWVNPPKVKDLKPGYTVPDARRRNLSGEEFIQFHQNFRTGFPGKMANVKKGYYSFYPKSGLPLKVIVMDTASRLGTSLGGLDKNQFNDFVIPELESSKAKNELVILASHHPSNRLKSLASIKEAFKKLFQKDPKMQEVLPELLADFEETKAIGYVAEEKFIEKMKSYPNIIAHIVGHCHKNKIIQIGTANAGYWEIQTSSLLVYPQQSRLLEIVYEGNQIGAIHTCVVDHNSAPGSLAARSRVLAKETSSTEEIQEFMGQPQDRNSILRFHIPKAIANKL